MRSENRMELWCVMLAALVYLFVNCYEGIVMDLIAWRWHKWRDRNDPKPEKTN